MLGVEWSKCHSNNITPELKILIDESYLLAYLDITNPHYHLAKKALSLIDDHDICAVMAVLLEKLCNPSTRKFLLEIYFQRVSTSEGTLSIRKSPDSYSSFLSNPINLNSMKQELMGLIMIDDVAARGSECYQINSLVNYPHLILEQWLMNMKLDYETKNLKNTSQKYF